jgi:hypothetical protein
MDFVSEDGRQLVNDIIRFENLDEVFAQVVVAAGLKTALPHVNKSADRKSIRM